MLPDRPQIDRAETSHDNTAPVPEPSLIVLIDDLIFRSKVRETLIALGRTATFPAAGTKEGGLPADGSRAALICDLGASRLDPIGAIRRAKAAGAAVLAFGSHVDRDALQAAREAGADIVVPRSTFAASLPELIGELTRPKGEA